MAAPVLSDLGSSLPKGFVGVTLYGGGALRVAVVVSERPDPLSGPLVVLRESAESRVYLGAMMDASGVVHKWLEVWVQHPEGVSTTARAFREALTNAALDRRWQQVWERSASADPRMVVACEDGRGVPAALYIDLRKREVVRPKVQGTEHVLELCTDEALLKEVGLEGYASSLSRYLWAPALGLESPFVPATPDSPMTGAAASFEAATGEQRDLVPLNPAAGRIGVRVYAPMSYEQYVDALGGATWSGPQYGKLGVPFAGSAGDEGFETGIFLGRHGRSGRVLEGLHLRLRALAGAVDEVYQLTKRTQCPLLNVNSETFRTHLSDAGGGLPAYWSARVGLARPGEAAELPIPGSEAKFFVGASTGAGGVYQPDFGHAVASGRGTLRLRRVIDGQGGAKIVEGTFLTQERISPSKNDLLSLAINLAGARFALYARLDADKALAAGEWRLKSIEMRLPPAAEGALKAGEGVVLNEVPFEIIPLTSSPCDLYALGVLGVRTLLVNPRNTLAVALDELLSLARKLSAAYSPDTPLPDRVGAALASDPGLVLSLGPQRLLHEELDPGLALNLVPAELWREVLGLLVSMFPGMGPDSTCPDFGAARAGGLHTVFEPVLASLRGLLVRTRSLILIDWSYNREVSGVIRRFAMGLGGGGKDARREPATMVAPAGDRSAPPRRGP